MIGRSPAIAGAAKSAATATPATNTFLTARPHTFPVCVLHTARDPRPASHWVTVERASQYVSRENQPQCLPMLHLCHRTRRTSLCRIRPQCGCRGNLAEIELTTSRPPATFEM